MLKIINVVGARPNFMETAAVLETQASSRDYGEKIESITACWHFSGKPGKLRWKIEMVDSKG